MRHRAEYVLFKLIEWLVLALPLKFVQRLGSLLGLVGFYVVTKRRSIALDNLRHAFPDKSHQELRQIAKGSFQNYGITLLEFLWFPRLTHARLERLLTLNNLTLLKAEHAHGRGMVMLSGHFGNWELIALGVAHLAGLPFAIIVQTQSNQHFDREINKLRCRLGNKTIPMGISVREIIKTLQQGGIVAMAPDQSGPMEGVFVEFFGRKVATHQGPAAFALKCDCPMQIGFLQRRSDGTYEMTLEEVPIADLQGASEENIIELTRRHTAILEQYIRRRPDHWLWMHRRWKHTWESVHRPNLSSIDV